MSACVGPRRRHRRFPRRWPRRAPSRGSRPSSAASAAPRRRRGPPSSARQSRSSTSGVNGAPGSALRSSRPGRPADRGSPRPRRWPRRSGSIGSALGVVVHRAPSSMRGARPSSTSLKSMPCGGRAMRTRRPSPLPAQGAVARRRLAGIVAIGEHDHVANARRQIERAQAGGRKRRPCRHVRSPAWRRGRSRCLRRPSARRPVRRGARRRRDRGRASSSADRPAPSRCRRGRGRCDGWPEALRFAPLVTSATIAGQMPPPGCFRPGWKRSESGGGSWMPREAR